MEDIVTSRRNSIIFECKSFLSMECLKTQNFFLSRSKVIILQMKPDETFFAN